MVFVHQMTWIRCWLMV